MKSIQHYYKFNLFIIQGNKNSIKQIGKELEEHSENNRMISYSNIHYAIKKEYERIKYNNFIE